MATSQVTVVFLFQLKTHTGTSPNGKNEKLADAPLLAISSRYLAGAANFSENNLPIILPRRPNVKGLTADN